MRPSPPAPLLRALAVAVLALFAAACSGADAGDAGDGADGGAGDVAATVGDAEVTVDTLEAEVEARADSTDLASELGADGSGQLREELQRNVLTELIRSELVRLAADRRDVQVDDADIADARQRLVESVGGDEEFEQVLTDSNVSDEQLERTLRDQAIQYEIGGELADDVTDDDVRTAFDQAEGQYGERREVRHILTETRAQARDALERIEGGEDFADVAADVSIDPGSGANGGDLGEIGRGATVPEFEEAAFGAEVGELVGPVESQFGFHVIEVTDTIDAQDFSEVRDEIRTQLELTTRGQAFSEFVTELIEDVEVTVADAFGFWDPATVSVVAQPPAAGGGTELPLPPLPSAAPSTAPSEAG